MRVDFESEYLSSEKDQHWLRMMRGARAVAASIVIAAVGVVTFSTLERSPTAPLPDATSHEYDKGIAGSAAPESIEVTTTPATRTAPSVAEEWKDPTLNSGEITGLLG
jgi:hypothetical protein